MTIYYILHFGENENAEDYNDLYAFPNLTTAKNKFLELKKEHCQFHSMVGNSSNTIYLYKANLKNLSKKKLALACLNVPMDWSCFKDRIKLDNHNNGDRCEECTICKSGISYEEWAEIEKPYLL